MVRTRLGTGPDGRPVVIKEADATSATALEREADLLGVARHPGVVEVAWTEALLDTGGFRVALRWAGGRTVADLHPSVEGAAALVAALATTVGDLHGVGVRHGQLRAEHVVLDGDGRPVLCGFGGAGRAGMPGAPSEAGDVAALGELLRSLVGADSDLEPIPEHRFARRRGFAGTARRVLLTLADQATADDEALRPSARGFAAAIAATVPGEATPPRLRLVGGDAPEARTEPLEPTRRRWPFAAAAVGVALLVSGISTVNLSSAPPMGLERPSSTTTRQPTETVDGSVVEVDGVRYAVGRAGDVLVMADWDCDGTATPAAVRPSTGELFVFDRWATPGADVVVDAVVRVPGAVAVEAAGCDRVVIVDADGGRTEVPS